MKKNLIKKVFAVSLSIAMACAALPAANPVTASAAAPYVSLKTTFKTLKVGQKYKMTLKNNTINWKIKKVETTDKPIATVYGKTASSVMIKGKSEGRATIRVRLQTTKRKTKNTKTLRCRVKVVTTTTTPTPVDPGTTTQTDITVRTQQELLDALAKTGIKKITIQPNSAVDFTIPNKVYNGVDLVVDAAQSEVDNSGTFQSITVENIKPSTFTERGSGNTINWKAPNGRLVVAKGASVKSVSIPTANAKVTIDIQEGTLAAVNVSAKIDLTITGKLAEGAAAVAISFTAAATDSVLTTAVKTAVVTSAKITAVFETGAEDSTIKLETTGISVAVTNHTTKDIVVTKNDGNPTTIRSGMTNQTVNSATSSNGGSGTWTPSGGGSSSGSGGTVKPQTGYLVSTGGAIVKVRGSVVTGSSMDVTSGSAAIVTRGGSFTYDISEVTVSGGAVNVDVEYMARVVAEDSSYNFGTITWTKMNFDSFNKWYEGNKVKVTIPEGIPYETLKGCKLVVQIRVAGNSAYSAGEATTFEVKEIFSNMVDWPNENIDYSLKVAN